MSAPPTTWLSNSGFNKYKGSYFNNDVDCSGGNIICRTGNIYLPANSKIYSPVQSITFNDVSSNVIFNKNITLVSSGVTYDVGAELLSDKTKLTNITYTAGTNTTSFTGSVSFPSGSTVKFTNIGIDGELDLASGTIIIPQTVLQKIAYLTGMYGNINTYYCDLSNNQTFSSGTKTWVAQQIFNGNLRLDGNLLCGTLGGTTVSNTTLQKINYLQNVTGDITTLYCDLSNNQTFSTGTKTFVAQQNFSGNLRLDGSLLLNTGALTLSNANLQKIQYLSNITTDISGSLTTLQNNINAINTSAILSTANTWLDNQTLNKNLYLKSALYIAGDFNVGPVFATATSISNATLQKIQYLSNITTDISGSLTTLQNNINAINTSSLLSTANTWSQLQTFNGNIKFPTNGTISSTNNTITFDDSYGYTNFSNNVHIYGNQQLDYGGTTYNVGYDIANNRTILTNVSYNSSTNTTTISGNVSIPTLTISGYVDTSNNQSINGIKTFNSPPVMSGASITAGTIPNTALATSYVPASGNSTIAGVKTFSSAPVFSSGISAGGVGISNLELSNLNNSTSNLQTQINNTAKTNTANTFGIGQQTITNNLRLDGSLLVGTAGATTITNATLAKINNISNTTGDVQTAINTLNTQTTGMSYSGGGVGSTNFSTVVGITGGQFAVYDNSANTTFYVPPARQFDISGSTVSDKVQEIILQGPSQNNISFQGGGDISGNYCDFGIFYMNGVPLITARKPILHMKTTGSVSTDTLIIDSNTLQTNTLTFSGTLNSISTTTFGYLSGVSSNIQTQFSNTVDLSSTQTIGGSKTFSNAITLSSGLVAGSTSISNTILGYLSGVSSNIQTQFSNTTDLSSTQTIGGSKTFSNAITLSNGLIAGATSISNTILGYISTLGSNAQTQITNVSTNLNNYVPIGTIIHHVINSLGTPYLLCDGRAVSRSTYAGLFSLISTNYGAGDGSTTFNLPNYSGAFLRGMGSQTQGSITYASDANPATYQADQMRSHTHNGQSGTYVSGATTPSTTNGISAVSVNKFTTSSFASTGGVNSGGNGAETRPFNYGIYMYIRAL